MSYDVFLTDQAVADIDRAIAHYASQSEPLAIRWCAAAEAVVTDLEAFPERFAVARESERLKLGLRQVNFGAGRGLTHRMVYVIRPNRVVVYAVRHLAQADLSIEDLVG